MNYSDDYKKIASEFLSLWQKQLASMIKEPDITGRMLQSLHSLQRQYFGQDKEAELNESEDKETGEDHASDPTLSQHRVDELRELASRLSACERRIAALESGVRRKSGRIDPKNKKSGKSGKTPKRNRKRSTK